MKSELARPAAETAMPAATASSHADSTFFFRSAKPVCASVRSWATAFASVCADPYSRRVVANLV
ncbi:hypothetical protein ABZY44_23335 [Streptomyces sp. NPDC006544]|uniref:hypothetical protein n=1 Tax=Streptomyces sp. NPDC006544 TaxID=3154583 RepID=UPI0033BEAF5B